jgi:hypothetical protein
VDGKRQGANLVSDGSQGEPAENEQEDNEGEQANHGDFDVRHDGRDYTPLD